MFSSVSKNNIIILLKQLNKYICEFIFEQISIIFVGSFALIAVVQIKNGILTLLFKGMGLNYAIMKKYCFTISFSFFIK